MVITLETFIEIISDFEIQIIKYFYSYVVQRYIIGKGDNLIPISYVKKVKKKDLCRDQ